MKEIKEIPLEEMYDLVSKPRKHPHWCACNECVEKGINQKSASAPTDHPAGCRCGKCGGFRRDYQ